MSRRRPVEPCAGLRRSVPPRPCADLCRWSPPLRSPALHAHRCAPPARAPLACGARSAWERTPLRHRAPSAPRGRTQSHPVVCKTARSYLRRDLRYDHAPPDTTTRPHVRPHKHAPGTHIARLHRLLAPRTSEPPRHARHPGARSRALLRRGPPTVLRHPGTHAAQAHTPDRGPLRRVDARRPRRRSADPPRRRDRGPPATAPERPRLAIPSSPPPGSRAVQRECRCGRGGGARAG